MPRQSKYGQGPQYRSLREAVKRQFPWEGERYIANDFGVSRTTVRYLARILGVQVRHQEAKRQLALKRGQIKHKRTMLQRYGVENAAQSPEIQAKRRRTLRERYGVDHSFQAPEIQEKRRRTMLERHGVPECAQSPAIQEKSKQTMRERYGVDNAAKCPAIQEKRRQTLLKKKRAH
jgi:hypothetical protein